MMLGLLQARRLSLIIGAAVVILVGGPAVCHAATGSVRIVITRTGFIMGGGSGTLNFQGKRYQLKVSGIRGGLTGAPRVDLVGWARHMRTAGSIHGVYSRVAADAEQEQQATLLRLKNFQGVVLELRGRRGVMPTADLDGMQISLRR